jgi:replicative DNA helicase
LLRDRFHTPAELDQVSNVLSGLALNPADTKDLDMLIRELKANRMCREMTQIIQRALPGIKPDTIEDAYGNILRDLLKLPLNSASGINVAKLREVHEALEERVLEYLNEAVVKMPTGIRAFDAAMGGFAKGELVLISAGVGHGKSNVMLWWAEQLVERGNNTLYITIEMSYEETLNRYHSIQTGFNSIEIADKRIPPGRRHEYFEKLIAANKEKSAREAFLRECQTIKDRSNPHGALALAKKYKNRPAKMFLMDLPSGCTPTRIEQEIQRLSMDNKIDCVFVDFINVMDPTFHHKERARELATISRELKIIARKCGLTVFTAAQLDTSSIEGTQDELITTDHIKYSKAIGENADWVMGFYRTEEDNLKKQIRFQMIKARHSLAVTALLEFDFATLQAIDLGFADGSAIPYGYLKNGMKTDDSVIVSRDSYGVNQTLGSLVKEETSSLFGVTSSASQPSPDDMVNVLREKFNAKTITRIESAEDDIEVPL